MRIAALVPFGFAIGAGACALILRGAPAAVIVDLAQPLAVVTYWQSFGALMWLTLFLGIAIASVGYIFVLQRVPGKLRAIAMLSALACGCALAFPVVFSSDVYAYAGYGDMALHGINPYAHALIAVREPLLDAMVWQWGNPPPMCVYGPAFVWLSKSIVALFLPLGVAAPLWAFRVFACAALVACAPLAYAAFAPFGRSRSLLAAAGIALNPIAIWSCAEGHNDAIVLALVLAGFALAARSRTFLGATIVALAALVKAPAFAAAAAFVLHVWKRPQRLAVLCGAALGTVIVIAIAAPLEYGVRAHLAPAGHYFPQFSLQYALSQVVPLPIAVTLVFAVCAVLALSGMRKLYLSDASGATAIAFAAWLAMPNPYPWYALWILPVAFLARSANEMWALIAASLLVVFRYYGDATTDLSPALSVAIVALQYALPILLFTGVRRGRAHRGLPEIHTPVPDFAPPHFP
mgnify:CR=1 FL=1